MNIEPIPYRGGDVTEMSGCRQEVNVRKAISSQKNLRSNDDTGFALPAQTTET